VWNREFKFTNWGEYKFPDGLFYEGRTVRFLGSSNLSTKIDKPIFFTLYLYFMNFVNILCIFSEDQQSPILSHGKPLIEQNNVFTLKPPIKTIVFKHDVLSEQPNTLKTIKLLKASVLKPGSILFYKQPTPIATSTPTRKSTLTMNACTASDRSLIAQHVYSWGRISSPGLTQWHLLDEVVFLQNMVFTNFL
jgi:hypothetical protein